MPQNRILILDFGSQVTQLIARRVREAGVYCEIHPFNRFDDSQFRDFDPKGIILSGGPASTTEKDSPRAPEYVWNAKVPVFGICYGQQTMCMQLGGKVVPGTTREFGRAKINVQKSSRLYDGIWAKDSKQLVWMSHGDKVVELPPGFDVIATSEGAPFAMIADEERGFYGVQYHPEVAHTPDGAKLIHQFVLDICNCDPDWTMHAYREHMIQKIRDQVGPEARVLCGLSGGVDSAVAAVLIHEAIGERLTCVYVDTGLMRAGETEMVSEVFRKHYNIPLIVADAGKEFLSQLEGVSDPEKKRKIIGKTFIDVFERHSNEIGKVEFLAQGTLYPDVIESVSFSGGPSVTIKSHHNVGGLPERMNLKLVEPLRELFKDEVRKLGKELGLPDAFIRRHPFPGPGLAIRIPGEITNEKIKILQEADKIYLEEIDKAGLYDDIWQAFAVLLPVKTVGVMGDGRSYEYVLALRAVTSVDGMTADYYPFTHEFLGHVSTRLVNDVKGINRVVYDITSKPPGTIEWE